MEWYYAVGDQRNGPVPEEEFKRLAAEGTIRPDTLVWRAGMDNWKPYREVTATAGAAASVAVPAGSPPVTEGAPVAGATGQVVCRECGKLFPPEEVLKFGDAIVCGECKPVYLQRMREGAGWSGAGATLSEDELLQRDYDVDIGESISQSWEAFKRNAGLVIGASVVAYLVLIACNVIPILSMILPLIISGPLLGGLWLFYIKNVRNEEVAFGDAFSGFGPRFGGLLVTYVVSTILSMVAFIPAVICAVIFVFIPIQMAANSGGNPEFSTPGIVATIVLAVPAFLISIYLSVVWMFALPIVADKGLGFWAAMNLSRRMVNKHWWLTFALMLVCGILSSIGALACLVGVLVTAPVAFGALAWHYQRVFGELAPQNQNP